MEKERFLAFTDAIIAIIATIMVLEFKTPDKSGWPALAELTIPLLAYALSFFMIMTVWYNHHQLYRDIKNITPRIFLLIRSGYSLCHFSPSPRVGSENMQVSFSLNFSI
ncbi:TMEM175 family protein [Lactococcus lactis]|uniref:TMEM175 family protein n=1 Tax=Lactococcus lactis TaxID=1358 RepID=UPI003F855D00